jgi:septation ring formation regulator EzrA
MQNTTENQIQNVSENATERLAVTNRLAEQSVRIDPFEEYIGEKLKRVHDGKVRFQALFDKAKTDQVRISYSLAKRSASEQEQIWTVLQSFYQALQHFGTNQDEGHVAVARLRRNLAELSKRETSGEAEQVTAVAGLNRRVSGLARKENASQAEQDATVVGLKKRVSGLAKKEKARQRAEDYLLVLEETDPSLFHT